MKSEKKIYATPKVEIVLTESDVITASGAINLPMIPASLSESGLFDLD